MRVANGPFDWRHPQNGFYNQLSRAFAQGQLYLIYPPSPELLALPDPWDPERNAPYSVLDFVLYNRRYYIYHGATPACLLFTPWLVLTGRDLPETFATFLFCYLGYLCSGGILLRCLRWTNLRPPPAVLALLLLALGICTPALFLLQRVAVYEVAISGAYFCLAAAFWFFARGTLNPRPGPVNLALAGLFLGLAIGCRPNVAFAAFFAGLALLWCLLQTRSLASSLQSRELLAFALPVTACVLLLAGYNYARFRDPFEFGLRYQMAGVGYFRAAPELKNLMPGLYYLLLSPPKFEPVFPFIRLGVRMPFNVLDYPLPKRYFIEAVGGALAVWPLTLATLAVPLIVRRWLDRPARALYGAMCLSALATAVFVASLGLVSHRFEMDFLPSFVLLSCLACAAVSLPGVRFRQVGYALSLSAVLYGLIVHLAIGIQGPYDGFVQARPASYVKLARWFSPLASLRPLYNPALAVEAWYEFPAGISGPQPLIAAGRCGSRYLLTAEALAGDRVRLTSAGAPTSDDVVSVEVTASRDKAQRVHLQFRPEDRAITVEWNGEPALRQVLPFLVTAPAQVRVGDDYTDPGLFRPRFPGRFGVTARTINGIEYH